MLLQLVVLSLGFSYLWAALPSGLLGFRSDRALFTGRWVVPVVLMTQWYGCEIVCEGVGVWWAPIHIQMYNVCTCAYLVNPRRACAARVTVVALCVCLSVCVSATILGLQATRRLMSDTNSFSATRAGKIMWRFC